MIRRLNERNQITIPPDLLAAVGADKGGVFAISADGGRIVLVPCQISARDYPEADWEALALAVREQTARGEYTEYATPQAAKAHLRKPRSRRKA